MVRQRSRDDRQVPKFRSNMTAPEIASMIESLFRVRGGTVDFTTLSLAPRTFLGTNGFQLDYEHLDSDELWRRGRVVGTVINGRLYLILLDPPQDQVVAVLKRQVRMRHQPLLFRERAYIPIGVGAWLDRFLPIWITEGMGFNFYFGGTSLLIVVVVVMDFIAQIQAHLMSHQYESLLKKANFKGGLPTR